MMITIMNRYKGRTSRSDGFILLQREHAEMSDREKTKTGLRLSRPRHVPRRWVLIPLVPKELEAVKCGGRASASGLRKEGLSRLAVPAGRGSGYWPEKPGTGVLSKLSRNQVI